MITACMPIARIISPIVYLNTNRYKSSRLSINDFHSLSNLHQQFPTQSFHLPQPRLHRKKFKCFSDAKGVGSGEEKKEENEDGKEERKAVETVMKLYTEIKNHNINGIAEVIGDECQCFCNFLSSFRLLQGKKQVLAFFYWLMMMLGNNIKLVVKPTLTECTTVGVQWRLEWEKPRIPLGKGFSFHVCHIYQGKLLIRNVEMFMEPILHMEPLRLRIITSAVSLAEKISAYIRPAESIRKHAATAFLLALLLLAVAVVFFTKPGFY